jgi:hypothetical protein
MRWLGIAAVVLAACWRTTPPPPPPPPPLDAPTVRFAVANRNSVVIAEASKDGVAVKQETAVLSSIHAMYWVGTEPVVLLVASEYEDESGDDPKLDGTVGRITTKGFEAYPALPPETWKSLEKPITADNFEVSWWDLVVTPTNEVWQGHCKRADAADMQKCLEWAWARIDVPGPATTVKPIAPVVSTPTVAPSPRTLLAFVPFTTKDTPPVIRQRLRCEYGNEQLDYPPEADLDLGMDRKAGIFWISTNPPVFQAVHQRSGFVEYSELVIFEGCRVSRTFTGAELVGGPNDMLAMFNRKRLSVRWRGHELGTLPGATIVRFARSTLHP